MAIARVQATPVALGTGTQTLTFGSPPAAGNFIGVLVTAYRNGAAFTFSCADNRGNTYTTACDTGDSNGARAFIFYAFNIATGNPFTITLTAAHDVAGSSPHVRGTFG